MAENYEWVNRARQEGFTDDEIAEELGAQHEWVGQARQEGFSVDEILSELQRPSKTERRLSDTGKTLQAGALDVFVGAPVRGAEADKRIRESGVTLDDRINDPNLSAWDRATAMAEKYKQTLMPGMAIIDRAWEEGVGLANRLLTDEEGPTIGERLGQESEKLRQSRSEETLRDLSEMSQKALISDDAEMMKPSSWLAEDVPSPLEHPDAYLMMLAESAPFMAAMIGPARMAPKFTERIMRNKAAGAAMDADKIRETAKMGTMAGTAAGTGAGYVVIEDAISDDVRRQIMALPDEKWEANPIYQDYRASGIAPDKAKQMIADMKGASYGRMGAMMSATAGAPAAAAFARIGAGVSGGVKGWMQTVGTETVSEAAQEVMEGVSTRMGVKGVDPEVDIWEGAGIEAMLGGLLGGTFASVGGISPKGGQQLMKEMGYEEYAGLRQEQSKIRDMMSTPEFASMGAEAHEAAYDQLIDLEERAAKKYVEMAPKMNKLLKRTKASEEQREAHRLMLQRSKKNLEYAKQRKRILARAEARAKQEGAKLDEAEGVLDNARRMEEDLAAITALQEDGTAPNEEVANRLIEQGYGTWRSKTRGLFALTKDGQQYASTLSDQIATEKARGAVLIDDSEQAAAGEETQDRNYNRDEARRKQFAEAYEKDPEAALAEFLSDPTTGLLTKRARQLDDQREGPSPAMGFVDVDNLGFVNDQMGRKKNQALGDQYLNKVTGAMQRVASKSFPNIAIYREGGDEIAVRGGSPEEIQNFLTEVDRRLASYIKPVEGPDGSTLKPTITWGVGADLDSASAAAGEAKKAKQTEGLAPKEKGGVPPTGYTGPTRKVEKPRVRVRPGEAPPLPDAPQARAFGGEYEERMGSPYPLTVRQMVEELDAIANRNDELAVRQREKLNAGIVQAKARQQEALRKWLERRYSINVVTTQIDLREEYEQLSEEEQILYEDKAIRFYGPLMRSTQLDGADAYVIENSNLLARRGRDVMEEIAGLNQHPVKEFPNPTLDENGKYTDDPSNSELHARVSDLWDEVMNFGYDYLPQEVIDSAIEEAESWNRDLRWPENDPRRKTPVDVLTNRISRYLEVEYQEGGPHPFDEDVDGYLDTAFSVWAFDPVYSLASDVTKLQQKQYHRLEMGQPVEVIVGNQRVVGKVIGRDRLSVVVEWESGPTAWNPEEARDERVARFSTDYGWQVSPEAARNGTPYVKQKAYWKEQGRLGRVYRDEAWLDPLIQSEMEAAEAEEISAFPEMGLWQKRASQVRATDDDVSLGEAVVDQLVEGWNNLPDIKGVRDATYFPPMRQLKLSQEGNPPEAVVGYFGDGGIWINYGAIREGVKNGIYESFEEGVAEVVMHEAVGHFGIRGLVGNQQEMQKWADQFVNAFPELAVRLAIETGMIPLHKVTEGRERFGSDAGMVKNLKESVRLMLGEEIMAYTAGQLLMDGKVLTPKQRNLFQRFVDWIRGWLTRKGIGRHTKFNQQQMMNIIAGAQQEAMTGTGWSYLEVMGRNPSPQMNTPYGAPLIDELNSARPANAKEVREGLKVVPVYPVIAKPREYANILMARANDPDTAVNMGLLRYTGIVSWLKSLPQDKDLRHQELEDYIFMHAGMVNVSGDVTGEGYVDLKDTDGKRMARVTKGPDGFAVRIVVDDIAGAPKRVEDARSTAINALDFPDFVRGIAKDSPEDVERLFASVLADKLDGAVVEYADGELYIHGKEPVAVAEALRESGDILAKAYDSIVGERTSRERLKVRQALGLVNESYVVEDVMETMIALNMRNGRPSDYRRYWVPTREDYTSEKNIVRMMREQLARAPALFYQNTNWEEIGVDGSPLTPDHPVYKEIYQREGVYEADRWLNEKKDQFLYDEIGDADSEIRQKYSDLFLGLLREEYDRSSASVRVGHAPTSFKGAQPSGGVPVAIASGFRRDDQGSPLIAFNVYFDGGFVGEAATLDAAQTMLARHLSDYYDRNGVDVPPEWGGGIYPHMEMTPGTTLGSGRPSAWQAAADRMAENTVYTDRRPPSSDPERFKNAWRNALRYAIADAIEKGETDVQWEGPSTEAFVDVKAIVARKVPEGWSIKANNGAEAILSVDEVRSFLGDAVAETINARSNGGKQPAIVNSGEVEGGLQIPLDTVEYGFDAAGVIAEFLSEYGATISNNSFKITDKMLEDFSGKPMFMSGGLFGGDPELNKAYEEVFAQHEKLPLKERWRETRQLIRMYSVQQILDRFHGIKRAMEDIEFESDGTNDPYIMARLSTALDAYVEGVMERGYPEWREGVVTMQGGKGLLSILEPVQNHLKEWGAYMAARRAQILLDQGRERLMDQDQIDKFLAYGEKYPMFEEVAKDYALFNEKMLDFAEASGIIDAESRAVWEHAEYVPFYRIGGRSGDTQPVGEWAHGLGRRQGISDQRSPIRQLMGGENQLEDIVDNITRNYIRLLDASVKNQSMLAAVDALNGSGTVTQWKRAPMSVRQKLIPAKEVERMLKNAGVNTSRIPKSVFEGIQKMYAIEAPSGPGFVSVMRDGKREYYHTNDDVLWRSMTAIDMKQLPRWLMYTPRLVKRFYTGTITMAPSFAVRNFFRDTLSAWVISRDTYVPFFKALKGLRSAAKLDDRYQKVAYAGGAFDSGFMRYGDPSSVMRALAKSKRRHRRYNLLNTPAKMMDAYFRILNAGENANRMAIYEAAKRAGKTEQQAVYEARDIMDFSMGGANPAVQFLIQTVPFLNARGQGLYRLQRGATEVDSKASTHFQKYAQPYAFAMKGMLLMGAGLALYLQYEDEDWYKELDEWVKDNHYVFMLDGEIYLLPKPFEVGLIFNTLVERMHELLTSDWNKEDRKLFKDRFMHGVFETLAFNPIPQIAKPFVEDWRNRTFFTDRDILAYYEEARQPPQTQYRYYTSPTMVEFTQLFDKSPSGYSMVPDWLRSPRRIEALYRGYTGTIGKYALMGTDAIVRNMLEYPVPPAIGVDFLGDADKGREGIMNGDFSSVENMKYWPFFSSFYKGEPGTGRTKYEQSFYDYLRATSGTYQGYSFLLKQMKETRADWIRDNLPEWWMAGPAFEKYQEGVSDLNTLIMLEYTDETKDAWEKREAIDEYQRLKNELFKEAYQFRPEGPMNPATPVLDSLSKLPGKPPDEVMAELGGKAPMTASLVKDLWALPPAMRDRIVNQ